MDIIYENVEFHTRIKEVFSNYLGYKKQSEILIRHKELNAASLSKYFRNMKTITRKLINLLYEENINIDWVCTGRGKPLLDKSLTTNSIYNEKIEIHTRITEAFFHKKIGQTELSEKYELSKGLINNFFNVNTTITKDLAKVCFYEDINIDWICTGRGSMFIDDVGLDELNKNEDFVNELIDSNDKKELDNKDALEEKTLEILKKLTQEQKEYYFHKISADFHENNIKKNR